MLIRKKWGRRSFLRAAGIVGGSAALLPMLPRIGEAADAPPKRLLLISTGNGSILPYLRPTRDGAVVGHDEPLAGSTSPILDPILDRHADKMILVDGVDMSAAVRADDTGSHGAHATIWTGLAGSGGFPSGPSVDQVIADHIGGASAVHSLQTATFEPMEDPRGVSSYATDGGSTPLYASDARAATHATLFGGFTPPDAGGEVVVDHGPARRRRSLDVLRGEISRLRSELPTDDKHRLDEHLCSFDKLEARLGVGGTVTVGSACAPAGAPSPAPVDFVSADVGLITQAFACDRTKVIAHSLTVENGVYNSIERTVQAIPTFDSTFGNDHNTSHATQSSIPATDAFLPMKQFEAEAVAQILDALAATPEGDGTTLLDNTIVVWGTAMSHGGPHDSRMCPWMIFHGANGPFRTNRVVRPAGTALLDLNTWTDKNRFRATVGNGYPNNRLLMSLLDAFEVPGYGSTFGDTRFSGGPLGELY